MSAKKPPAKIQGSPRLHIEESVAFLRGDPHFTQLISRHGIPNLKRGTNIFQARVRSIIHQQLSGKAAGTIYKRFTLLFRKKTFPTPEEVLAVSVAKLRSVGLSSPKVSYIRDVAEKFSNGTIRHRKFSRRTSEDIIEHLVEIRGVGVWTAHMLLIFTLNRPDILPVGDLGIRKGFQIVYGLKRLPTPVHMERLAKNWREHASIASWYLWRATDEEKKAGQ